MKRFGRWQPGETFWPTAQRHGAVFVQCCGLGVCVLVVLKLSCPLSEQYYSSIVKDSVLQHTRVFAARAAGVHKITVQWRVQIAEERK